MLAKDLGFIDTRELGTLKKDIAEIERMLKALIKSFGNKPLDPCPRQASLGPSSPTKLEKNLKYFTGELSYSIKI